MAENKEFKKFERNLNNLLSSSSAAGSWSDLLPFTKEIYNLFDRKKEELNYTNLTDRNTLAKRLAQCLNPECPGGVHEVVLNIYNLIFQNILSKNNGKLEDNLGIYCSGLFPFFSYASIQNKVLFLDNIVTSCLLKLDQNELNLCLPGLLSSLIPGLDDNNETTSQKIYSAFDTIQKIMKRGVFYGTYWSLLLKNKSLRTSGIKYISERIIRYNDYKDLEKEKKEEILENEYPNINNLVVNSLSQLIEYPDIPTVRIAMDFVITRLPLTKSNTMLSDDAKIVLLISALKLLIKNEYSTTRRLSNWLLGSMETEPDEEAFSNTEDCIYIMDLVVNAFKIMFNSQDLIDSENLKNYIKILDQLFAQQIDFADYILSKIAYNLILCFVNYWQKELYSREDQKKEPTISILSNFFIKDSSFIQCLWKSITNYLDSVHDRNDLDFDTDEYTNNKNIEIFLHQLLQPLKFCSLYLDLPTHIERVKYYIPIIHNLLKIINKFNIINRDSIQRIRHILFTTLVFTKNLQENTGQLSRRTTFLQSTEEGSENGIGRDKEVYHISKESSFQNLKDNEDYQKISSSLIETIQNYQKSYIKILEQFLLIPKDGQITKNEINILKQLTELIIRLQEYAQNTELPEWVKYLEKIIFKGNKKLSLEAINSLLILNLSFFNNHEIYTKIKHNFLEGEIDSSVIEPKDVDKIIKMTGVNKNCRELLTGKLYLSLNEAQSNQKTIIDLLIKISRLDPIKFINILENTFKLEASIENSVKLFSDFWQLLNEYYNEILFFKKGECVLEMVDYLDSNNPVLRLLSRSWLNQSTKQFQKIIDPILKVLLDESIILKQYEDIYFYEQEYNTNAIMDSFHKLKNIILNTPIMQFFIDNSPNNEILEIFKSKKYYCLDQLNITYLHILISISLKFTQGNSKKAFSEKFKMDNLSINATSCEFLEFLLSHVDNPNIIMDYSKIINVPIIELINRPLISAVMQVQLLSVLKVLYFKTDSIHSSHKKEAFELFGNKTLIECLYNGIINDIFFVREIFINFTGECLVHLRSVIYDNNGEKNYYSFGQWFLSELTKFLSKRITIDIKGRKDTEKFSHFDDKNNINYFIFKNYLDEYKEYKFFDEGDILLLLKGIKQITFHFFNINSISINKEVQFWFEFKNKLIENLKTPSGFLFGLFTEEKKENIDVNIKRLFSTQISKLLQSFLLTWINKSNKYVPFDYCVSVNGILPYKEPKNEQIEGLESTMGDPIKKIVTEISFNLFYINPIEFMETILDIWCHNSSTKNKKSGIDITIDAQYKITIIEFLISLEIPLNIIIYCVNAIIQKNLKADKIEREKKKKPKYVKDKRVFITPNQVGIYEAKVIHFLYSYILLNPKSIDKSQKTNNIEENNEICDSWREIINFLNTIISDTKIINTFCWLYELMEMTLMKYELPKNLDSTTKGRLFDLFNIITEKLSNCVFNNKTDSTYLNESKIILPYLPHVYLNIVKEVETFSGYLSYLYNKSMDQNQPEEIMLKNRKDSVFIRKDSGLERFETPNIKSTSINSRVNDFYNLYFSASKLCTERVELNATPSQPPSLLNLFYRQLTCITLKENFFPILSHLNIDLNSLKKNITDIIRQLINFLKTNLQIKNNENEFYAEYASDFLYSLMEATPELVTICGKSIFMEYLNDPSFFITTPKILSNLRKFISLFVKNYSDLLGDLIRNINTGFFFLGGNDEDKIKTLRRISFVIYSCENDTFQKDFDNIKEKAKSFLTSYKDNSKLEGEIFLMMRVLFLRFSHEGVMKMIKDLWPIIFTELIENIKDEKKNKEIKVLIECFKFIELLSLANVEEFSLYQWIFLLDTFNMKDLDTRNPESLLSDLLKKESKIFRPIALDIIDKGDMNVDEQMIEGNHKGKSELVVCPKNENLEELQKALKQFFYSIGDMNNYKVELNKKQIEDIIEKDFLDDGKK